MLKKFVAAYLNFTKKQRNGTLVLLLLIAVLMIVPFLFPFFIHPKNYDHQAFEKEIAALKIKQVDSSMKWQHNYAEEYQTPNYAAPQKRYGGKQEWKGELFYFNPNTLDVSGWKKLGLGNKIIATINNYLSKGGKFYKPDDLGKIWGLSMDEKERLIPFVQIEKTETKNSYPEKNYSKSSFEKTAYSIKTVDINLADTAAFIALPGIGSKLSQRIINFREKLGGFYKIEQVAETFGLPDTTFQKIKQWLQLNNTLVKQLNINTATVDELKAHPYIRYAIANVIVQYRNQHGNFSTVSDLKKIMLITDEVYNKMEPYISL